MTRIEAATGAALAAALSLAAAGCSRSGAGPKPAPAAGVSPAAKVSVVEVSSRDWRPSLTSTGTLVPERKAEIRSLVGGRIDAMPVDIGTRVRKGQLLYEIRLADFRLAVDHAEAAVVRARVQLEDHRRERARMEGLFKEGSATEQMRDQAATAAADAEAALKQAESSRDMARQALEDATGLAPYDGVITARMRQRGEFVNRGDPIVEIMDLSSLDAEMEVPEPYAGRIEVGLDVEVALRSGGETAAGKVIAVNPKVDPATRTFKVKVRVENPLGKLQAGLFCTGTFRLPERAGRPAIPAEAVIRDEGRSTVWVVEGRVVRSRRVTEDGVADGWVFVSDGLRGGERVVVSGGGGLHDGAAVEAETPSPSPAPPAPSPAPGH